jgi:hypothetical protein
MGQRLCLPRPRQRAAVVRRWTWMRKGLGARWRTGPPSRTTDQTRAHFRGCKGHYPLVVSTIFWCEWGLEAEQVCLRTCFALGSSASRFALASRRWSLAWPFSFFALWKTSSRFRLFFIALGANLCELGIEAGHRWLGTTNFLFPTSHDCLCRRLLHQRYAICHVRLTYSVTLLLTLLSISFHLCRKCPPLLPRRERETVLHRRGAQRHRSRG